MMRPILVALCLCLTLTPLLAGCSKPQNAIIGKWKSADGRTGDIQFFKDGTFSGRDFTGSYTFPDDTHLRLGSGSDSTVGTFRIDGDTLTLTLDVQGTTVTRQLHRVKE